MFFVCIFYTQYYCISTCTPGFWIELLIIMNGGDNIIINIQLWQLRETNILIMNFFIFKDVCLQKWARVSQLRQHCSRDFR